MKQSHLLKPTNSLLQIPESSFRSNKYCAYVKPYIVVRFTRQA